MRGLRWMQVGLVAMVLMAGAGNAHALIHLELEGGGGLNLEGPLAPMATARVGLDLLSVLDVGLRAEGVFGTSPNTCHAPADCIEGPRGYQAWSVFPELRLRTPIPIVQVDIALGAGLGYLKGINLNQSSYDLDSNDSPQPFGQVGIGVRLNIPTTHVYIRAEGSASVYTGVTGPDIVSGGLLPVYQLQIMLGYDGIGF